jgi:rhamnose utilization protein RhaD (predicted bifunctional aldolase and dehydrogenase)/NAD(P)-dependent dehydrogenase (short-subunit alcohol dehydrogenase family)
MNHQPIKSLWSDEEAGQFRGELGLRVYTSRLLGRDKSLVLHGGGNTSVKIREKNILGEEEELLYVKGSGWDLETIEVGGFTPVHMPYLLKLAGLEAMSDMQMSNELLTHMKIASAPSPSVETILHALLPYKYVDHTHADAFISVSNTGNGLARLREIYGDLLVYIPYVMPGFDLARLCAELFPREHRPGHTLGMALEHHGIFSFGQNARESYEQMINLVRMAEDYLRDHKAWQLPVQFSSTSPKTSYSLELAQLRREVSSVAGAPVVLSTHRDERSMSFVSRKDFPEISQRGPATPDHVIRTKRLPMVGRDVKTYASDYAGYFSKFAPKAKQPLTMLDAAPRVILDRELGRISVGRTAREAAIVSDIYEHTMDVIERAGLLGGWEALPAHHIFDVEYWELEQMKLRKSSGTAPYQGEIALVTGAASGIGKACVDSLLKRGACVVGLDINSSITALHNHQDFLGLVCDITCEDNLHDALEKAVLRFGGLDMMILNAGIFPKSCNIENLDMKVWRQVMQINLDANLALLQATHPLLKCALHGGRVVVVGSKNVPAPGPGAAAYSTSKAAMNQLARVTALEWGKDRIRINSIHPNAVFDTGLWTEEVLLSRAKAYGLSIQEYKTNNVLKAEVSSRDVAELAAEMCGALFAKTTGAQVPVDGGNDRVI